MEQGSDEWHIARLGKATGSNFGRIMTGGKTRETYLHEVVCQKLTQNRGPDIRAAALDWGHEQEPQARLAYSLSKVNKGLEVSIVREDGFVTHPEHPNIGCSVDGLVGDDGIIEIKCPYQSKNHYRTLLSGKVPKEYTWQVYGNMWVTGRKWCDFISFDPRYETNMQMAVVHVEWDDALIGDMAKRIIEFVVDVEQKETEVRERFAANVE